MLAGSLRPGHTIVERDDRNRVVRKARVKSVDIESHKHHVHADIANGGTWCYDVLSPVEVTGA